jgi:hypothetical protein
VVCRAGAQDWNIRHAIARDVAPDRLARDAASWVGGGQRGGSLCITVGAADRQTGVAHKRRRLPADASGLAGLAARAGHCVQMPRPVASAAVRGRARHRHGSASDRGARRKARHKAVVGHGELLLGGVRPTAGLKRCILRAPLRIAAALPDPL